MKHTGISRKDILVRLRSKVAEGWPIIGGCVGTGISAKCEETGGIDLIVIDNSVSSWVVIGFLLLSFPTLLWAMCWADLDAYRKWQKWAKERGWKEDS